jgi:hypothetical protein
MMSADQRVKAPVVVHDKSRTAVVVYPLPKCKRVHRISRRTITNRQTNANRPTYLCGRVQPSDEELGATANDLVTDIVGSGSVRTVL